MDKDMQDQMIEETYNEGYNAFYNHSLSYDSNPYKGDEANRDLAEAWWSGYEDARDDADRFNDYEMY